MSHRHRTPSIAPRAAVMTDAELLRPPITAAPHDFPDQIGTPSRDGAGPGITLEDLASRFLNDAVDSDFPARLASEEHEREVNEDCDEDTETWEAGDLERILHSSKSLARLIEEASSTKQVGPRWRF